MNQASHVESPSLTSLLLHLSACKLRGDTLGDALGAASQCPIKNKSSLAGLFEARSRAPHDGNTNCRNLLQKALVLHEVLT